ncbi:hypothetical protein RSO68_04020 [Halomonas saccharevitans]|uniref:Uncharacterized protein n=1 Tax=Halomonas saccharevitans TaxID=416872 RepID=A0ABU3NBR7_9GAMM|nr:hypothetical protein [Halomonas saccharevitans]MDT8878634.1 hypothetical protein [Halomonas saccharevitans]
MNRKHTIDLLFFFFFFLQIASVAYLYFYWKYLGVDAFLYISIEDILLASGGIVFLFSWVFIIICFSVFFMPGGKDFQEMEDGKPWLGFFGVIVCFLVFLGEALYLPEYMRSYFYASITVFAYLTRYLSSILFHPSGLNNIFNNKVVSYICLSLVITGLIMVVPLSIWNARVDVSRGHAGENVKYVAIAGCEECYFGFLGKLGDYVFMYSSRANKIVAIPSSRVESITYH